MRIALITIHHFSLWFAQCKTRLDNDVLNNPASHPQYFQQNRKDANKNLTVAYRLSSAQKQSEEAFNSRSLCKANNKSTSTK